MLENIVTLHLIYSIYKVKLLCSVWQL